MAQYAYTYLIEQGVVKFYALCPIPSFLPYLTLYILSDYISSKLLPKGDLF